MAAENVKFDSDESVMRHALQVAAQGIGSVEPNPPVGAVVVDDNGTLISEGFHERFGAAHAEVNAISRADGNTRGQQLFVTLEPCNHTGKTPPCTDAVIQAGFRRVVIGCVDPADHSDGMSRSSAIDRLRASGIEVSVGVCGDNARQLIAPFRKLMTTGQPWVHAKWAMTLDGRIASRTGHSKWISGTASREYVHKLRGRMDSIITGAGTVAADDPLLTARPPGLRTPVRVVIHRDAESVRIDGKLAQSINQAPLLLCVSESGAATDHVRQLQDLGAEVFVAAFPDYYAVAQSILQELGRRKQTHVLLEGGPGLLGSFFDRQLVDEVHVFVSPKIVGGFEAMPAVGGYGAERIPELSSLSSCDIQQFERDVLISGRLQRTD